ncbi:VOC family protein [Labilibaculum antarcticum]|uniref:Glyoxalase n=1 Tax=Labilibaculum antarcticum TaxID=1717717 RepID=A0A1Y1CL94_9BACT|nr:VOC family protein [Labilibaculum antarcticum]BAX81060.1 glyoxalase [Labilibaculum antarcticum]
MAISNQEESQNKPVTSGAHHIGFTVSKLVESAKFFTHILGWTEVGRKPEYPAIFVSDGKIMITLWASIEEPTAAFNRKKNVGLHHFALQVESEESLLQLHKKLETNGIKIEFAPELLNNGSAKHMMCYEPSGIRIEFIWLGN